MSKTGERTARPQDDWYSNDRFSRRVIALVSVVVMTMLAVMQVAYSDYLVFVPFINLVPPIASWYLSVRGVSALAIYNVVMVFLLGYITNATTNDHDDVLRTLACIGMGVFAVVNANVRRQREASVIRFSQVAEVAQTTIIRPLPARLGPAGLASRYLSATAGALIGGDFYAAVSMREGVRLLVGDVRGKGLPAVHSSATALFTFRAAAGRSDLSLEDVGVEVETALQGEFGPEDFATAVFCQIEPNGTMFLANYGHPSPLLIRATGEIAALDAPEPMPPLGLALGLRPTPRRDFLQPGDRVLMFTDGLIEARDERGRFFPLLSIVPQLQGLSPDEALDHVLSEVAEHTGSGLSDDLALVLVEMGENGPITTRIQDVELPLVHPAGS